MNRETLYRGMRLDNGKWVYGYYVKLSMWQNDTHLIIGKGEYGCTYKFEVDPDTVGEYTGLKDKNGVKIFVGDIIKAHYANAVKSDFVEYVVFHNGRFSATPDNAHCWTMLADGVRHPRQDNTIYMESCEVIGNIYDNPELLKEAKS